MVGEERADDRVDLLLVVATAGFEFERNPLEHDHALRMFHRDLDQPTVAEEGLEDVFLVFGGGPEAGPGAAGRPHELGGWERGVHVEPVGPSVVCDRNDPGGGELPEL